VSGGEYLVDKVSRDGQKFVPCTGGAKGVGGNWYLLKPGFFNHQKMTNEKNSNKFKNARLLLRKLKSLNMNMAHIMLNDNKF
jgi:hypothetical protein